MEQVIRTRVFIGGTLVYDGLMERQKARESSKISLTEVVDLKMQPVIEGQLIPESGEIETKWCCVEQRNITTIDNEDVVTIHGYWC